MKPFCFVLMPFGTKRDENGKRIQFDEIYKQIIHPAIVDAGFDPIRADEEQVGGIIHKPMFERLMLCDYAVADLTSANPNVLYELGIRHGLRPHSTVLIFAKGMRLPFDVAPLRGLPYKLNRYGPPSEVAIDRKALTERLNECRNPVADSPLFQLIADFPQPDIARLKTDTFRDVVEYSKKFKEKLRAARGKGHDAITAVEAELNVRDADPAIVIDLFLSYRAVKSWQSMVDLVAKMAPILARTVLVGEQNALALNRLGRWKEAESVLLEIINEHGPSSETHGILGRVYKDMWESAHKEGRDVEAAGWLAKAIDSYITGFESDWRDAYPGVNAVTLMEFVPGEEERQAKILPVVRYSAQRRVDQTKPDYWDHATLLELAVIARDQREAGIQLGGALTLIRERWEPETTARNLRLIREHREKNGEDCNWLRKIESSLIDASKA